MKLIIGGLAGILTLTACATPREPNTAIVTRFAQMDTPTLCSYHGSAQTTQNLLAIEAELGARNIFKCSQSYVGDRTNSTVGKRLYGRQSETTSNDRDCRDFSSPGDAQRFFIAAGGPLSDPHDLDGDGDGSACEWGRQVTSSFARYKPKPARSTYSSNRSYTSTRAYTPRRSYSSGACFTGPRGGTYTITASGRKNYGGC